MMPMIFLFTSIGGRVAGTRQLPRLIRSSGTGARPGSM
jgi:hypothetical protein